LRAAEQQRPEVAEALAAWREDQKRLDPRPLVFLDETSKSQLLRSAGYGCA
jgi:hypothetical protein